MPDPGDGELGDTPQPEADDDAQPRGLLYISDVQALKRAEAVSFHLDDGDAYIHARLTTWAYTGQRIYTAKEQQLFPDTDGAERRRRIDVDATIVGFDDDRHWHERALPGASARAAIHTARLDEVWCSIAAFLRVGDVIALHWRADNNTPYLSNAGLHRDELRIGITREKRRWVFLMDVGTSPDNTARMITRNPPP
jgi:hypothetical protein